VEGREARRVRKCAAVWFAISFIFVVSLLCAEQAGKVESVGPMTDNAVPRKPCGRHSTQKISPDAHFFRIRDRRRKKTLPALTIEVEIEELHAKGRERNRHSNRAGSGKWTFSTSTPDHINIRNRQARALLVYACVLVVVRAAKAAVATVSYLVPADPAQTIWKVLFHHQRAAELLC